MKPQGSGGNYEKPPIKAVFGRILGIYDVGTQPPMKQGDSPSPTVVWEFELTGQKQKTAKGENFRVAKFMKSSNNSNGSLMKWFLALTDIKMTSRPAAAGSVWYDLPDNFNAQLKALVGRPVFINLIEANDKVQVDSISEPPEGSVVPDCTFNTGWLDFDDPENFASDWRSAPEWICKIAAKSEQMAGKPEPKVPGTNVPAAQSAPQSAPAGMDQKPTVGEYKDDIPY